MNYSTATSMAHFYDEDNVEIGKMKLRADQIKADAEFSLWKHLIELGILEGEEECVENLFERLNKELGIDEFEFDKKEKRHSEAIVKAAKSSASRSIQKPSKIPTNVAHFELIDLYDILYTRDLSKKTKKWHDGVMKYHPKLRLAEFHDATGTLIMKKTMEEVKEGNVIEGASVVIEICAFRSGGDAVNENSECAANVIGVAVDVSSTAAIKAAYSQNSKVQVNNTTYGILYTTDKHKKAKKWLDGRLDYDPISRLAKFIDDEGGNCFYKKVMREGDIVVGDELQSGMYIIQIDHLIEKSKENSSNNILKTSIPVQPQAKKVKSVIANESVPLEGRSNEQLLSLLKSRIQKDQ